MEKIRGWNMSFSCNIFNYINSLITRMNPTGRVPEAWHQMNSRCHSSEYIGNNTISSVSWREMIMRRFRGCSVQRPSKRVPSLRLPYFQYGWKNILSPVDRYSMAVRQSGLWWMPDGGSSTQSVAVNFIWACFLLLLVFTHPVGGAISQLDDPRMLLDIRYDSCNSPKAFTCALKFNNVTAVCFGDCDGENVDGNYVTNVTLQEELKMWCDAWPKHMERNLHSSLKKRNGSVPGCGVLQNTHGWILDKNFNVTGVVYQYALNGFALTEDDVADLPSDPIRYETDRRELSKSEIIEHAKQFIKVMPILRQCLDVMEGIPKKEDTPVKDDTPDRSRAWNTNGIAVCCAAAVVVVFIIWLKCSREKKRQKILQVCCGRTSIRLAERVSEKEEKENEMNRLQEKLFP